MTEEMQRLEADRWASEKKNFERSYKSMWDEIYRLRAARDKVHQPGDAARDLVLALEFEFGDGLKVSERVFTAYVALAGTLHMDTVIKQMSPKSATR